LFLKNITALNWTRIRQSSTFSIVAILLRFLAIYKLKINLKKNILKQNLFTCATPLKEVVSQRIRKNGINAKDNPSIIIAIL